MQIPGALKIVGLLALGAAEVAVLVALAAGADGLPTDVVMVGDDSVIIEVQDQRVYGALSIDRIVTPVDGWVILRVDRDGVPGELIGAAPVGAGESRNVGVVLDRTKGFPAAVFVSLLADRGRISEFEYTTGDDNDSVSLEAGGMGGGMGAEEEAAGGMGDGPIDQPLSASGSVVTARAAITPFSIVFDTHEANIGAAVTAPSGRTVSVRRIVAPVNSWVVIIREPVGGGPSEVIGSAAVPAGPTGSVDIELSEVPETSAVTALLLADLGAPGVLEVDPVAPSRGADSPYIVLSYFVQIAVPAAQ